MRFIVFGELVTPMRSAWQVIPRRATTTEWVIANPCLLDREVGVDTTTNEIRIGDGATSWVDLPVATPEDVHALITNAARTEIN